MSNRGLGEGVGTILASSTQFKTEFAELKKDTSTGKFRISAPIIIPDTFDGRVVWKDFLQPIKDQGSCGSCWAMSSLTAFSARLSIATQGKYNFDFSAAEPILCDMGADNEYKLAEESLAQGDPYDYNLPENVASVRNAESVAENAVGCNGETLIGAWQYLYRFGAVLSSCVKYDGVSESGNTTLNLQTWTKETSLPECSIVFGDTYDDCPNNKDIEVAYFVAGYYYVPGAEAPSNKDLPTGDDNNIKRDIFHWGPVSTGFMVYEDFLNWQATADSVYIYDGKSKQIGGHAVVILGWGTLKNVPYWLCQNSWSSKYGDNGYFKIQRGVNMCQIEENVFVGLPDLFGMRLFLEWPLLYREDDYALRSIWQQLDSGYKVTTLEKMTMGKLSGITPELITKAITYPYKPEYWPDFSLYVAGKPWNTVYRLRQMYSLMPSTTMVFGFVIIILIFVIIYLYKKNRK